MNEVNIAMEQTERRYRMLQSLILGSAAVIILCAAACGLIYGLMDNGKLKTTVTLILDAGIIAGAVITVWSLSLYKAFVNRKTKCRCKDFYGI